MAKLPKGCHNISCQETVLCHASRIYI